MDIEPFIRENKVIIGIIILVAIAGLYQSGNLHSLFQSPSFQDVVGLCPLDNYGNSACALANYGMCCNEGNVVYKYGCVNKDYTYSPPKCMVKPIDQYVDLPIVYYIIEECKDSKVCVQVTDNYAYCEYGVNECYSEATKCEFPNYFECGDYDGDSWLEWSEGDIIIGKCGVECKINSDCSAGICNNFKCENVPSTCSAGETRCEGSDYYTCGENEKWFYEGKVVDKCGIECLSSEDCEKGFSCDNNKCVERKDNIWMLALGGMVGLIIILGLVYIKVSGERRPYYHSRY